MIPSGSSTGGNSQNRAAELESFGRCRVENIGRCLTLDPPRRRIRPGAGLSLIAFGAFTKGVNQPRMMSGAGLIGGSPWPYWAVLARCKKASRSFNCCALRMPAKDIEPPGTTALGSVRKARMLSAFQTRPSVALARIGAE